MNTLRVVVALAGSFVGGWLTVPCALLVLFGAQGFGNDRDVGARALALVGYGVLTLACLEVSMLLARWLATRVFEWALGSYVVVAVVMLEIFA
jgi:hypothetical protein